MTAILPAFPHGGLRSGTTLVDTSSFPWPGATFGVTTNAAPDLVEASFADLARTLGIDRSDLYSVRQVHGAAVCDIKDWHPACEADAIVSDRPGTVIGVKIADCCAILIHDSVRRVVAAVHSGWRGTAQHILTATISHLTSVCSSRPEDLDVYLSACAGGDVYEVGDDVADQLREYCTPLDAKPGKWLFDNHEALLAEAQANGVDHARIIVERACTITDHRFHSHRRDGARAGRCFAFIGLVENT